MPQATAPASRSLASLFGLTALPGLLALSALGLGFWTGCGSQPQLEAMQFFRGNTHTHTLWSDGDAAPELATAWYRERDFDFLVLSEHNTMAIGTRWFEVGDGTRLTDERLTQLQEQFGAESIELRDRAEGGREMRLQTLEELRARFEAPGEFLMIAGEEITDSFEGANVHVNGINLSEIVKPQHGDTLTETVRRNVEAAAAQGAAAGRPVLSHLNHPNFTWSLTWEDFATVPGLQFFEVYNGHPSVHNSGDAERPATERMWDFVNTRRLREASLPLIYGVATDDAHHYHEMKLGRSNPGRGYVQVAARALEANAIVEAMQAGHFYGSSGVDLLRFHADAKAFELEIAPEEGVSYRVQFIGTRGDEIGALLDEQSGTFARYECSGDELFVRAVVISDRLHPNPAEEGEFEQAWLQPVLGPAATQ
jgi:hypothetical protein